MAPVPVMCRRRKAAYPTAPFRPAKRSLIDHLRHVVAVPDRQIKIARRRLIGT